MFSIAPMKYNAVARMLHWIIALLILGQFIGGWLMTHKAFDEAFQYQAFQYHKSFGLIVLALSIVRLFWRLTHKAPELPSGMAGWEIFISKITHILFYVLMIGVPLVGWLIVSASPLEIPTKLFFTIPVPHLPVPVKAIWEERFSGFHEFLAFATIGLFFLHVGAAAKHYFISRDSIMYRMAGGGFGPLIALAFAGAAGAAVIASMVLFTATDEHEDGESAEETPAIVETAETGETAAPATASDFSWAIIPEETALEVELTANGGTRTARFATIDGEIILNPDAPEENGLIDVTIATRDLSSPNSNAANSAHSAGWLNTGRFPTARFTSDTITLLEDCSYSADGTLTLIDVSQPLTLPFTLTIEDDHASAQASVVFDRMDFGIGADQTDDTSVTVSIEVGATQSGTSD